MLLPDDGGWNARRSHRVSHVLRPARVSSSRAVASRPAKRAPMITIPITSGNFSVVPLQPVHVPACEVIARALPEWFGVEEGQVEMRGYLDAGVGFVALADGEVVGFSSARRQFEESWEITWMAVARVWHRRGVGRRLVEAAMSQAKTAGARWLLVKTLADLHPSVEYRVTREFYRALGFGRLSVLPDLWGPDNPGLLMARAL